MVKQGVIIREGAMDWQIFQQEDDGRADIPLAGEYYPVNLPEGAQATVWARVVHESTGEEIVPWTQGETPDDRTWRLVLRGVPAGGLYRLETQLRTGNPEALNRGDMIFHVGVGDVFLIAGQSNAAGRCKDPVNDPPEPGVHVRRNSGKWDMATPMMNETTDTRYTGHYEPRSPGYSPYMHFGKYLKEALGYPIGLIPSASGGSPLRQWNPAQDGDLYENMLNILRDYGGKLKAVAWYQGCADGFEYSGDDYLERFSHFVSCVRRDLNQPDLPFLTVQINRCTFQTSPEFDEHWGKVREAQRQAAKVLDHVTVVPSIDLKLYDYIHNSAASGLMVAERSAKAALGTIYGREDVEWRAPEVGSVRRIGDKRLRMEFKNVVRGLNMFMMPAELLPFTIVDGEGEIKILSYEQVETVHEMSEPALTLTLEREPREGAVIHGAWQMNPTGLIPCDWGGQPMLAFYGLPIE